MTRAANLIRVLERYRPDADRAAWVSHARTIGLMRTVVAPFDRECFDPGHLTASAVVLSADGEHVLIHWHERLARWLQPGGHFEAHDTDGLAAARRETLEETGVELAGVDGRLVGVDVHRIPAARGEPAHWHHDLVFGFRLSGLPESAGGDTRAEWCAIERLPLKGADEALRRAVARARMEFAYSM